MSNSPADIWNPDIFASFPPSAGCSCCHDDGHAALLDVLKSVEWITDRFLGCGSCPSCNRSEWDGHAPECALDAALRAATP